MTTVDEFLTEWYNDSSTLMVHTSGSTGKPKPLLVEKQRMEASARMTCQFLGLKAGDSALLCLPLDYIAGKMMMVRALTWQLRLVSVKADGHPLATIREHIDFAAMVPLQVWNSLQVPAERERLMDIHQLIIGGGAIDESLESQLRTFPHAVWSTYGMTETLSHIALRRLSGEEASSWYTPFEGVHLSLDDEGCLTIDAPHVCPCPLVTNDIAELQANGSFRILGRRDNVVCSGGIKIQIEEVERLLLPHLRNPFCISRRKDARLGEALVLLTEAADTMPIEDVCEQVLPRYWHPRYYVCVDHIPMTATGKISRKEAEGLAVASSPH
ncbi:MAG: AMP-binding protein [Prevotella sp.]|nr:AMP-binding protein [Prevotella sp.]